MKSLTVVNIFSSGSPQNAMRLLHSSTDDAGILFRLFLTTTSQMRKRTRMTTYADQSVEDIFGGLFE